MSRKRFHYRVKDKDGRLYIDRSSVPNRFTALRYACQEICERVERTNNGLRVFAEVLDLIRSRDWEDAVKAYNAHPDAGGDEITIVETDGVHPNGYKARRNHSNIVVPSPAPTQEEINEGNIIDEGLVDRVRYDVHKRTRVSLVKESGYILLGPVGVGAARPVLAEAVSFKTLFKKVRTGVSTEKLGHRIFAVNDHGSVTEYDRYGKEIGSWV